jgi:hypothetical protein
MGLFSSPSNAAAQAAAAQEAQRENTISTNVNAINSAFTDRQGEYDQYRQALQHQYETELNRQQAIAGRNQKFALARSGLTGGSAAVDAGKLLGQEEAQGTVKAEQSVNSGVAGLQNQDEATRQQMISLAQSGGDIGNAAIQTANQLRSNIGNAKNVNAASGLGDVFGATTESYQNEQTASALRNGLLKGQTYAQAQPGSL